MKNPTFLVLFLLVFASCSKEEILSESQEPRAAASVSSMPPDPAGWTLTRSGNGVKIYYKNTLRAGSYFKDYVVAVDLSSGASISNYYSGGPATPSAPSPLFLRKSFGLWGGISSKEFVITNGGFFDGTAPTNTQLSFPLKQSGTIVSCGYGNNENLPKLKIGLSTGYSTIANYTNTSNNYNDVSSNLVSSTVMVGLHPIDAYKYKYSRIGRTFLGNRDFNGDGTREMLYLLVTSGATQDEANQVLTSTFACPQTIMFDGSGSSQMKYKTSTGSWSTVLPGDYRLLPYIFVIKEY